MVLLCQQAPWDMKYIVFCLPNAENMEWEGAVARREVLPQLQKASHWCRRGWLKSACRGAEREGLFLLLRKEQCVSLSSMCVLASW